MRHSRALLLLFVAGLAVHAQPRGGVGGPGNSRSGPPGARPAIGIRPQQSLIGTAKVEGRVVHRRTGEPIPRATVSLRTSDNRQGLTATADAEGKFVIGEVAAGSYRIGAERRGFLRGDFGSRRQFQSGSLVTVADGQEVKGIDIKLEPQSVISGQVLDENGEPLDRAQVEVLRYGFVQDRQQLVPVNQGSSDDLGNFRIWNLAPGRYYVRVQTQGRRGFGMRPDMVESSANKVQESYVPTFFPGVAEFQSATPIEIAVGQDFSGLSLQIQKARVYRVTGKVEGVNAAEMRMNRVMLLQRSNVFSRPFDNTASVRSDGSFEIGNVLPGSYDLALLQGGANQQRFFRTQVEVSNADLENVVLAPGPVFAVQGSIRVEGETTTKPGSMRVLLSMREPGFIQPSGTAKEDGSFVIENVSPDKYRLNIFPMPEGAFIKSIRVSGQDVTRAGLDFSSGAAGKVEVILSDKPALLDGAVERASADSMPGVVVLVPEPYNTDDLTAIVNTARNQASVDQNGRFTIKNIPPGSYRVYAFEEFEAMSGFDPERLKKLEKLSETVKLGEGESKTLALKQIPPDEGQPR